MESPRPSLNKEQKIIYRMVVALLAAGALAFAGGGPAYADSAPNPALTTVCDGTDSRFWLNTTESACSLV